MQKQENQAKENYKDYFCKLSLSMAKFETIHEGKELSNFIFLQLQNFPGVAKISIMLRGTFYISGTQNSFIDQFFKQFRLVSENENIPDYKNIKNANWMIYPLKSNLRLYGFVLLRLKRDNLFNFYKSHWSDYLRSLTQFLENVWLKQKLAIEEQKTNINTKSELSKEVAKRLVDTAKKENTGHLDLLDDKQNKNNVFFKEIFQFFSGAVVLLTPVLDNENALLDFNILSTNPRFENIFGEVADSAKPFSHYFQEDFSYTTKMALSSSNIKQSIPAEEKLSTSGSHLKIEFLPQKYSKTVIAIIQDITKEIELNQYFKHMMDLYNKLLIYIPAGILFIRRKVVTMANPAARKILGGITQVDIIGQNIVEIFSGIDEITELFKDDKLKDKIYSIKGIEYGSSISRKRRLNILIAPEDRENLHNSFFIFQDISSIVRLEKKEKRYSSKLKKQIEFWKRQLADKVENLQKSEKAIIFLLEDVNEGRIKMEYLNIELRKEIKERLVNEEKLQQQTRQLKLSNGELEAFSYSISHDLRAPLRHMSGFIELLSKHSGDLLDTPSTRYMEQIEAASMRMGVLIDSLLEIFQKSRQPLNKRDFPLKIIIDEIISEYRFRPELNSISFIIEDLPTVKADRILLRQAIENLFSNAVKFSRDRKVRKIKFALSEETNLEWVFYIKDNGVGFNEQYVEKLFGVFQRLHSQEEFEGTGIGLAIVKKIIERHEGRIWATSSPGKGATFYFSLPKDKHSSYVKPVKQTRKYKRYVRIN